MLMFFVIVVGYLGSKYFAFRGPRGESDSTI